MNTQSLNRSIGLAMTALQQARAKGQHVAESFIMSAIRLLNKARVMLRRGNVHLARFTAASALADIRAAILAR